MTIVKILKGFRPEVYVESFSDAALFDVLDRVEEVRAFPEMGSIGLVRQPLADVVALVSTRCGLRWETAVDFVMSIVTVEAAARWRESYKRLVGKSYGAKKRRKRAKAKRKTTQRQRDARKPSIVGGKGAHGRDGRGDVGRRARKA